MTYNTQLDLFQASEAIEELKSSFKHFAQQLTQTQHFFNQQQQFIGSLYMDLKKETDSHLHRLQHLEKQQTIE